MKKEKGNGMKCIPVCMLDKVWLCHSIAKSTILIKEKEKR